MKFNLVSYDGVPERSIEPVSDSLHTFTNVAGTTIRLLAPAADHGRVVDFEFVDGAAYPNNPLGQVHRFD